MKLVLPVLPMLHGARAGIRAGSEVRLARENARETDGKASGLALHEHNPERSGKPRRCQRLRRR